MKWFKHDSDAHRDAKLKKLIMNYGLEGYGLYWYLLEQIAHGVTVNQYSFELDHDSQIIAFDTGLSVTRVEEMMRKMVELSLFECSDGVISCLKMAQRIDQSMTSNPQMREIINQLKNPDAAMTKSGCGHDGVMPRLDKIRSDKKKTISRRFSPPTLDECVKYFSDRGYPGDEGERFFYFYESNGWKVGKNKMKSWRSAASGWISRKKPNPQQHDGDYIQ